MVMVLPLKRCQCPYQLPRGSASLTHLLWRRQHPPSKPILLKQQHQQQQQQRQALRRRRPEIDLKAFWPSVFEGGRI